MSSLLNTWVETIKDQLQSLAQIFQIGCRICGVPHFDGECEGHTMLGIGHLDPQSNPNSPTQHQSQSLSFEVNPHSTSNTLNTDLHSTLSSDLIEPVTQVVDENVVTRLETSTDTVPLPCPEYNIFIESKTIGRKVGFASGLPYKPSLHHIMTYTSWSDMDTSDQPILSIQNKEVLEVERFVIPPVEQFPYFEPSPYIGHTLALICLKLLGMYQYYHLCLLMDARKPLGLPDK